MTEQERSIQIDQSSFALLRTALSGEATDFRSLTYEFGDAVRDALPRCLLNYTLSEQYKGDLPDVLSELGLPLNSLLDEAYEQDFSEPERKLVEALQSRIDFQAPRRDARDSVFQTFEHSGFDLQATREFVDEIRERQSQSHHSILDPQLIANRYWLQRPLGEGAFAVVYRCFDTVAQGHVAIKIVEPPRIPTTEELHGDVSERAITLEDGLIGDTTKSDRSASASTPVVFEALLCISLQHQNILPILDWGHLDRGRSYIVSKECYFDLSGRMTEARLTLAQACSIVAKIADALSTVHSQGIIHRDVKPANILIGEGDIPFLGDFGLACSLFEDSKTLAGTPGYMSPEQVKGVWLDGRTDLYSLGVTLYQLTTGELPFRGGLEHVMRCIKNEVPAPPRKLNPDIPKELEDLLLKAMSKDVTHRFQSANEMSTALSDLSMRLGDTPESARPLSRRYDDTYSLIEVSRGEISQGPKDKLSLAKNLERAAESYLTLRNLKGAAVCLKQALEVYSLAGATNEEGRVCWHLAKIFHDMGDHHNARQYATTAIRELLSEVVFWSE